MTLFKTTALLALCSVALTACNEDRYYGSLTLNAPTALADKKGNKTTLESGTYDAALLVGNKKGLKLRIEDRSGEKKEFLFKNDKGMVDAQGNISLAGVISGQDVDLKGTVSDNHSQSETIQGWETCTYSTSVYECHHHTTPYVCQTVKECNPENPSQCKEHKVCSGGETVQTCGYETRYHTGSRWIEYFYSYHSRNYIISLLNSTGGEIGKLRVGSQDSDRHVVAAGHCSP